MLKHKKLRTFVLETLMKNVLGEIGKSNPTYQAKL